MNLIFTTVLWVIYGSELQGIQVGVPTCSSVTQAVTPKGVVGSRRLF